MYSTDAMEYGVFPFSFPESTTFSWVYPTCCGYGMAEAEKTPLPGGGAALLYLLQGEGEVHLGQQSRTYQCGCLAVAQCGESLTLLPKTKTEYLFLSLEHAQELLARLCENGFLQSVSEPCRAPRLLGRICYNASVLRPGSIFSASADAFSLLMELLGYLEREQKAYPPLIQEALHIIRQDFAFLTGVEELADRLAVSREHLIRTFRAVTGESPGQCLQEVKLDNARLMLQNRDYSIEMVADMTGYSGANYFCKVFRRAMGESPGEYRARTLGSPIADAESQKKLQKMEEVYHI